MCLARYPEGHGTGTKRPQLPITMAVLCQLIYSLNMSQQHTAQHRAMLCVAILVAFHSFPHCGQLTWLNDSTHQTLLTRGNVTFDLEPPVTMAILLRRSKTDPFGQRTTMYIGPALKPYCAVTAMLKYLVMTRADSNTPPPPFPLTLENGQHFTCDIFTTSSQTACSCSSF